MIQIIELADLNKDSIERRTVLGIIYHSLLFEGETLAMIDKRNGNKNGLKEFVKYKKPNSSNSQYKL